MSVVELITWNLNSNDAAQSCIVDHVKRLRRRGAEYLIALQEGVDDADELRALTGSHATGNGPMVLLSSSQVTLPSAYRISDCLRFVMGVVTVGNVEVAVFNYHGHSKSEPISETARGGYASEYRWAMEQLAASRQMLVMGDFNECPTEDEVAHRACFYSPRIDEQMIVGALRSHLRPRVELRVVHPPDIAPAYYYHAPDRASRPVVYSYFVGTATLAAQLSRVRTLKQMGKVVLTDQHGQPRISDHLPVSARWEI